MYAVAAISIGLLGSLHCMGMCGPLLAAVSGGKRSSARQVLHHSGRLMTYMVLGAIAGALGQSVQWMGGQQLFSLTLGFLMVASVILIPFVSGFKRIETQIGKVAISATSAAHRLGLSKPATSFLTGTANGLLPCGLVYLAVAGAANTFTPWDGAIFMLIFGAGTLPALVFVSFLAQKVGPLVRTKFRRLVPVAVLVLGGLLMVRGMNLGIPYLSPQTIVESSEISDCHP